MKITTLRVSGFRNLKIDKNIIFSQNLNGLWGDNGQGKTNVLEALHVALKGESFRPYCQRSDFLSHNAQAFVIEVNLAFETGYEYNIKVTYQDKRWQHTLNGKKYSTTKFRHKFPVVTFCPDDHQLIRGSPEQRRLFLNKLYADVVPGYIELLSRFENCLKSRNLCLKERKNSYGKRAFPSSPDLNTDSELKTWSELLSTLSVELQTLRRDLWVEFKDYYLKTMEKLEPTLCSHIDLFFKENCSKANTVADYLAIFQESLMVDLVTGWTHKGIQRDDFEIQLKEGHSRGQASQGQARLLALALRWTHSEWIQRNQNERPLFLIDDFSSELDSTRREKLITLLRELKSQVFITGTDASLVDWKSFFEYNGMQVQDGSIKSQPTGDMDVRRATDEYTSRQRI